LKHSLLAVLDHEFKPLSVNVEKLGESDFEDLDVSVEKICCAFCEQKFFIPANLDSHVKRKHERVFKHEPFKCLFCSKVLRGKCNFGKHLTLFHKDIAIRCKYRQCFAVFKTKKCLKDHLEKIHCLPKGKNPIECEVCKNWYPSKLSLETHMKRHAQIEKVLEKKYECLFCNEFFVDRNKLNKHAKENHKSEGIKCQQQRCRRYFKSSEEMKEHFENTHKNKCKFCSSNFVSHPLFSSHMRKVHLEKKCNFSKCNFYTDFKEELKKHIREKHERNKNKISDCVYCGISFTNAGKLAEHVRYIHPEIAIRCNRFMCSTYFKSKQDLEEHKKVAHKKVEKHRKSFVCLFCRKTCLDRGKYSAHIKKLHAGEAFRCKNLRCCTFFKSEEDRQKHDEEKHAENYCCALCDYKAPNRCRIMNHLKLNHFPKEVKCPKCPKLFANKAALSVHLLSWHESKKCPHCNQTKSYLDSHLVTTICPICSQTFPCKKLFSDHKHKDAKVVHECLECGEKFKIGSSLKYHINLRHKFGKKWDGYKCKYCKNLFRDLNYLRSHQQSEHFDLMEHKCEICGEPFDLKEKMLRHVSNKHKIGGFECELCEKRFHRKYLLVKHFLNQHFNNPSQFVECADCGQIMNKIKFANHFIRKHM